VAFSTFCLGYGALVYKLGQSKSDAVRLGVAGSMAAMITDCSSFMMDTVNSRAKVEKTRNSTLLILQMLK
jgi:fluoride ion exporter CrcB/FEX